MSSKLRRCLWIGLTACLGGCGTAPFSLSGSIGEVVSIDFDRASIRRQNEAVIIEYFKDVGTEQTDKPCRLVFDAAGLDVVDRAEVRGDLFLERIELRRVTWSRDRYPVIARGSMYFSSFPRHENDTVDGTFEILFENGRTLLGEFSGLAKGAAAPVMAEVTP